MWKLFPVSQPESSVTSTFITRLPAKGRHQWLSSKQSQGTTPLALPLAGTQPTSHSKSCPDILPAFLFSSWKITSTSVSTLYTENLLVGKYFVCAIPQDVYRSGCWVYLLLNEASSQTTWMQPNPHCSSSLPFVTHIIQPIRIFKMAEQSFRLHSLKPFTELTDLDCCGFLVCFRFKCHLHKQLLRALQKFPPSLRFPPHAVLICPILQETNTQQWESI